MNDIHTGHLSRSPVGPLQGGACERAVPAAACRSGPVRKQAGCGQLVGGQEPVSEVTFEVYLS